MSEEFDPSLYTHKVKSGTLKTGELFMATEGGDHYIGRVSEEQYDSTRVVIEVVTCFGKKRWRVGDVFDMSTRRTVKVRHVSKADTDSIDESVEFDIRQLTQEVPVSNLKPGDIFLRSIGGMKEYVGRVTQDQGIVDRTEVEVVGEINSAFRKGEFYGILPDTVVKVAPIYKELIDQIDESIEYEASDFTHEVPYNEVPVGSVFLANMTDSSGRIYIARKESDITEEYGACLILVQTTYYQPGEHAHPKIDSMVRVQVPAKKDISNIDETTLKKRKTTFTVGANKLGVTLRLLKIHKAPDGNTWETTLQLDAGSESTFANVDMFERDGQYFIEAKRDSEQLLRSMDMTVNTEWEWFDAIEGYSIRHLLVTPGLNEWVKESLQSFLPSVVKDRMSDIDESCNLRPEDFTTPTTIGKLEPGDVFYYPATADLSGGWFGKIPDSEMSTTTPDRRCALYLGPKDREVTWMEPLRSRLVYTSQINKEDMTSIDEVTNENRFRDKEIPNIEEFNVPMKLRDVAVGTEFLRPGTSDQSQYTAVVVGGLSKAYPDTDVVKCRATGYGYYEPDSIVHPQADMIVYVRRVSKETMDSIDETSGPEPFDCNSFTLKTTAWDVPIGVVYWDDDEDYYATKVSNISSYSDSITGELIWQRHGRGTKGHSIYTTGDDTVWTQPPRKEDISGIDEGLSDDLTKANRLKWADFKLEAPLKSLPDGTFFCVKDIANDADMLMGIKKWSVEGLPVYQILRDQFSEESGNAQHISTRLYTDHDNSSVWVIKVDKADIDNIDESALFPDYNRYIPFNRLKKDQEFSYKHHLYRKMQEPVLGVKYERDGKQANIPTTFNGSEWVGIKLDEALIEATTPPSPYTVHKKVGELVPGEEFTVENSSSRRSPPLKLLSQPKDGGVCYYTFVDQNLMSGDCCIGKDISVWVKPTPSKPDMEIIDESRDWSTVPTLEHFFDLIPVKSVFMLKEGEKVVPCVKLTESSYKSGKTIFHHSNNKFKVLVERSKSIEPLPATPVSNP